MPRKSLRNLNHVQRLQSVFYKQLSNLNSSQQTSRIYQIRGIIIKIHHRQRFVHISYAVWSYPFPAIFEQGDLKDKKMFVLIHCLDYLMRFTRTFS